MLEIKEILQPFFFFSENPIALKRSSNVKCKIEHLPKKTLEEKEITIPIRISHIKASLEDRLHFKTQIVELLKYDLIRCSKSGYSFLAFMVSNHNEQVRHKPRMVINYIQLNKATISDAYWIPIKDELFQRLRNSKYFSKFD